MPLSPVSLTATPTSGTSVLLAWEAGTTYVVGTDGERYHVFQLPCAVKEYDEGIGFSTFRNQLSDGFRRGVLFGSSAGLRSFRLSLPTLKGYAVSTVEGVNGEALTEEAYLWSLYCEWSVTHKPFVIKSVRNDQYYLVDFLMPNLTYSRMLSKLYSTGIELTQARIENVSVFDPEKLSQLYGYWDANTDLDSGDWNGTDGGSPVTAIVSGDVVDVPAAVNGHQIKRLSNTSNTGAIGFGVIADRVYDIIIAMKMREATFSNDAGIFVDVANEINFIRGDSGTTEFQFDGFDTANTRYFLNGQERNLDDMQAPMNTWGVVHFRNLDGWPVADGFSIGVDSPGASAFAEMDLGDVIFLDRPSLQDAREITEHLMVKYL